MNLGSGLYVSQQLLPLRLLVLLNYVLWFTILFIVPPRCLQSFISDKTMPSDLEYMVVSLKEPQVYLRQWSGSTLCKELQFSSEVDCQLLECRNLTMRNLVKQFHLQGQVAISIGTLEKLIDGTVLVDPIFINFGQHSVHSINTAIQAWQQVRNHVVYCFL